MLISKLRYIAFFSTLLIASACSDSTTGIDEEPNSEIEVKIVENLHAPADRSNPDAFPYIYFNLRTGETVGADQADTENWDIAFRGSSIIVNSGSSGPGKAGAILLDIEFEAVEIAPSDGYRQDGEEPAITGSGGWFTYTGNGNPPRAVISHEDTTIVLKTADGNHYAKLHIMSYYKDNPDYDSEEFVSLQTRPASQYYTFRYATQMTEGMRDLK